MSRRHRTVTKIIDDVTATTTATTQKIEDAKKVMLVVERADHSSGTSAFTATVSVDGTNFIDYNKWIDNVTNTNAQDLTRVKTKTLSADGLDFVTMDLADIGMFTDVKVTVTEGTDGTHSAWLVVEY